MQKQNSKKELVNDEITESEVRLIDENGVQVGIVPLADAQARAVEADLDLVQINQLKGQASIVKIMDYSKHRYEMQKRAKDAKKHQVVIVVKEVKFSPSIGEHDYQTKLDHVKKFIDKKNKVKVTVQMSRRELAHPELAVKVANRVISDMGEAVEVETKPSQNGRMVRAVIAPAHK